MRHRQRITLSICLLTFCLASESSAQSPYTVTDLGTLPGGNASEGEAVNIFGEVTGVATTSTGDKHAFLYSAGTMTDLGTLGGNTSGGYGINDAGQVTGQAATSSGYGHAFLYSANTGMVDLGTLGTQFGLASHGYGINNSGQVTGGSDLDSGGSHAFLYSASTGMVDLGTLPGGTVSRGYGINDSGQVTGYSVVTDNTSHAFLYSASTGMVDLGTLPGGIGSSGAAINTSGQVAGVAGVKGGNGHAIFYSASTGMVDLGTLGGDFSFGAGINDFGDVVGHGDLTKNGEFHAFVYTSKQGMVDLNSLIPPGSGWFLGESGLTGGINDFGQITGVGFINGAVHAFLLTPTELITPQENSCPCRKHGGAAGNASEPQVGAAQGGQGDPVNTAFGSFSFSEAFNDITVSGRGLSLSFANTYSSVFASVSGPLGYGWTHDYSMRLIQQGTSIIVAQENGSQVTFSLLGTTYSAPPRVIATLVKNTDGTFTFTRRAQQSFTFSATGQLTAERDRNGYATSLAYNSSGQLASVTDPAGRALTFVYTGSQLTSVTDPISRKIQFAYDSSGNLVTVTNVAGGQTKFTYSPSHLLLTATDPRGGVVTNTYDSSNRVITQTDQLGRKTTFSYTLGTTTTTDPKGNVVQEQYNQFNQRISLTRGFGTPEAATWSFAYDPNTLGITSVTDPNNHTATATYDANGNLLTSTDALGRVTTRTWDSMNDLTSVTDPLTVTTTMTYDANGNLLTRSRPLKGGGKVQTYTYKYGDSSHPGDVTSMVDPLGKITTYTYDANGDRITATDPLNHTTKYGFNGIGWLTSLTDARGKTTNYTRNLFGNLTVATDPLGHKTTRAYDANRNLTSFTDANGNLTSYTYDAANERIKTTRADGTTLQSSYNADGTVAETINGLGNATSYGYDPLARPISVTDPLSRTTSYTYDGVGNQLTLTDPSGQITTDTYDAANQNLGISYSDGKTHKVTLVYDQDGQLTSMTDGTGTSSWTYDSLHRITGTTTGAGANVNYAYDLRNQLTVLTYPGGAHKVTRNYDAAGRLTAITDWLGNRTAYAYDPNGNMTVETLPAETEITSKLAYDDASRLTGIVDAKGNTNFATFSYTRDANNQLTGVTETGVPMPGTDTVGYTQLNQLASVNSANYTYDAADDVTGLVVPAQVTLQYDAANELTKLTAGTMITKFSYDSRGDRLRRKPPSGPTLTYVYDQTNRLVGFGSADTYAYAGDGLRMGKTVKGKAEAFTWDRSGPLPLLLRNGTVSYIYDPLGLPLEQVSSTGMAFFYLHDQLGSTRLVSNSSGAVQVAYTYDAYGNLLGKTGTLANPFGYAGQFTDSESELLYLRARYYDPTTAQFISRDPLVESTGEAYVYVGDNPLNGIDPTGLSWLSNWWNRTYDTFCANHPQTCGGAESAGGNVAGIALPTVIPLPCSSDIKAWGAWGASLRRDAMDEISAALSSLPFEQRAAAQQLYNDLENLPAGRSPADLLNNSPVYQVIKQMGNQNMVRPFH